MITGKVKRYALCYLTVAYLQDDDINEYFIVISHPTKFLVNSITL